MSPTRKHEAESSEPLLTVEGLTKRFQVSKGVIFERASEEFVAVDDVSFQIRAG